MPVFRDRRLRFSSYRLSLVGIGPYCRRKLIHCSAFTPDLPDHNVQIVHPSRGGSSCSKSVKTLMRFLFLRLRFFCSTVFAWRSLISAMRAGCSMVASDSFWLQKNTLPFI